MSKVVELNTGHAFNDLVNKVREEINPKDISSVIILLDTEEGMGFFTNLDSITDTIPYFELAKNMACNEYFD